MIYKLPRTRSLALLVPLDVDGETIEHVTIGTDVLGDPGCPTHVPLPLWQVARMTGLSIDTAALLSAPDVLAIYNAFESIRTNGAHRPVTFPTPDGQ